MDKNHINILHIASGDLWAGAEVQLFTLVTALNAHQMANINVVLLNHGTLEQKLLASNIHVIVLDESKLNSFHILQQLIKTIAKIQPDIIHTHRIKENILGSIAGLLNGNIASVRTAHGAPEHKPAWFHTGKRLILFVDWLCARFLQKRTVAVSQDLADILQKSLPKHKISVIENGIDIDSFLQQEQPTSEARKQDTAHRIAIAGRLSPVKRIDIFIRTAQHIKQNHPELNLSFHIYGDGPLREELVQLSKQLQTTDIVHFEGHCTNIKAALDKTDILLMTSDHEGLPMILLEAMATRVPIVAHAVGGIPNLLDHGKCGTLVKGDSPEAYADAIQKVIQQPEEKIQQAFTRLTKLYSAEQNATNYLNIYQDLVFKAK
ncbi:MAG: glycosyltransferase [Gammaproteobacteria bacterium]|nr:glycosyltransferase [Gammaproteobacteria bacterium]